ncbi:hypothetical protein SDC9_155859 [bioreactor metagenome]|uniref:Uncharacterized protein n=1 Tax=bioreactor metagenome TaxID=1076179 RepID=A0A645F4M0_9ZZZZ
MPGAPRFVRQRHLGLRRGGDELNRRHPLGTTDELTRQQPAAGLDRVRGWLRGRGGINAQQRHASGIVQQLAAAEIARQQPGGRDLREGRSRLFIDPTVVGRHDQR